MSLRLQGRVGLVVGAAGTIGKAVVARCQAEGATIIAADRVMPEAGLSGVTATVCDALTDEGWRTAIAAALAARGELDFVVNTVGTAGLGPVELESLEHWRHVVGVNLDSAFLACRYGVPAVAPRRGCIINFSSSVAARPHPLSAAYSASKAAIIALTRSAALRCGQLGNGVRVNCLMPGAIDSPMVDTMLERVVASGALPDVETGRRQWADLHPLGRLGRPVDIAAATAFLVSDDAAFVTGIALAVDGGYGAG